MARNPNWSEEEVRHALALYLVTPFGRLHSRNPEIVALAARLGRSANAVALKLVNLAALDESLPRKGMSHAAAADRRVWAAFRADPSAVLEAFRQQDAGLARPDAAPAFAAEPVAPPGFGEAPEEFVHGMADERRAETVQRVGQEFFRRMILASYDGRCALTGIEDRRLLNASHIVPWKDDVGNRVNPANGICLNALHDRAFDRHLITFDEDYRMRIAPHVPRVARRKLEAVESPRLVLPKRFLPEQALLEQHRRRFFEVGREGR